MVLVSCSSARFSPDIDAEVSHTTTTKRNEYDDKANKSTQKWAGNDRQHRQTTTINQQFASTPSYMGS